MLESFLPQYDVFVSYSHHDKAWVQKWLVPNLENESLRACIDIRDFELGAPKITEMERAVLQSRRTLLVLTPDYLRSQWTEMEYVLSRTMDPAAHDRRVLPLLLRPCSLPLMLDTLIYLDFSDFDKKGKSYTETPQFNRLILAIGSDIGSSSLISTVTTSRSSTKKVGSRTTFSHTKSLSRVTIAIDRNTQLSGESDQATFIRSLARVAKVGLEEIRILHIASSQMQLTIEIPRSAAKRLITGFVDGHPVLKRRGVVEMLLHRENQKSEPRG